MPKFLIQRDIPQAGKLSTDELRALSRRSNEVLERLGPEIQWVETYVSDDKLYCVYNAPSPKLIEEHAKCGGFPANRISQVRAMMDPTTAEA